jgi:hypothetical protein
VANLVAEDGKRKTTYGRAWAGRKSLARVAPKLDEAAAQALHKIVTLTEATGLMSHVE